MSNMLIKLTETQIKLLKELKKAYDNLGAKDEYYKLRKKCIDSGISKIFCTWYVLGKLDKFK